MFLPAWIARTPTARRGRRARGQGRRVSAARQGPGLDRARRRARLVRGRAPHVGRLRRQVAESRPGGRRMVEIARRGGGGAVRLTGRDARGVRVRAEALGEAGRRRKGEGKWPSRGCPPRCRARRTGASSGSWRWMPRDAPGGGSTRKRCGRAWRTVARPTRTGTPPAVAGILRPARPFGPERPRRTLRRIVALGGAGGGASAGPAMDAKERVAGGFGCRRVGLRAEWRLHVGPPYHGLSTRRGHRRAADRRM